MFTAEFLVPIIIEIVTGAASAVFVGNVVPPLSFGPWKNAAIGAIGGLVLTWVTARTPGLEQFVEDIEDAGTAAVDGVGACHRSCCLGLELRAAGGRPACHHPRLIAESREDLNHPRRTFGHAPVSINLAMSTLCLTFDAPASLRSATHPAISAFVRNGCIDRRIGSPALPGTRVAERTAGPIGLLAVCVLACSGCSGVQSALDPAGEEAGQIAELFWVMADRRRPHLAGGRRSAPLCHRASRRATDRRGSGGPADLLGRRGRSRRCCFSCCSPMRSG